MEPIRQASLQAARLKIKIEQSKTTICAIYCPPRFSIKVEDYNKLFKELWPVFIVGGDFNAKHPWWGSRIANPKGKELYKCITQENFTVLSTGRPTYWPSDPYKIPDLMDFAVYNGIPTQALSITENDDLVSDHSSLIVNYNTYLHTISKKYSILSHKTDIQSFQYWLEKNINLKVPLKTEDDLFSAVETFTGLIHEAAALSTPNFKSAMLSKNTSYISSEIRQLVVEKRKLRRIWKLSRCPADKANLNKATKRLKILISEEKDKTIENFLQSMGPSKNDDVLLWRATRYIKRPTKRITPFKDTKGEWCRSDEKQANAFAEHLEEVFKPFEIAKLEHTSVVDSFLCSSCQIDSPIKHITAHEVAQEIQKLNNNKSPGFDCITPKTVKCLPHKAIVLLTRFYNAILRLNVFPVQWKCAEIIMLPKTNKSETCITSYRPISLLAIFSKIFESIFLRRLLPILNGKNIIPEHQFGFRNKHGTPEQCHRVTNFIADALENKKYCSGVFLDVKQAFDKVWHKGLLYKIKLVLPAPYFLFFKNYLNKRTFYVKVRDENSKIFGVKAGIPQGSVLGPILYTLYTADMPVNNNITIATFADDTAVLALAHSASDASSLVQKQIKKLEEWFRDWNIVINADKSTHVTFTLRKNNCPAIHINNSEIPQSNSVKYLGMHLDRRLTWRTHIQNKKKTAKYQNEKNVLVDWQEIKT